MLEVTAQPTEPQPLPYKLLLDHRVFQLEQPLLLTPISDTEVNDESNKKDDDKGEGDDGRVAGLLQRSNHSQWY